MAKTIDYLDKMADIARYEHEGFEYDALHVSVMYRKGVGFMVSYQPVKRNGYGGFETGPLPSSDPLVGGKTLLAENADKNSEKKLRQMQANMEAGLEAIVWLFDCREFDKLNIAIVRLARDGYKESYRKQMRALMARTNGSEKKDESPMMKQFKELKEKHPDSMLLFRNDRYYQLFNEDAKEAVRILGINGVQFRNDPDTAMALFEHEKLDTYLPKLVRAGKRIAICDQLPDPPKTKRGITETINNNNNKTSEDKTMATKKNNEAKNAAQQQVNNSKSEAIVSQVDVIGLMNGLKKNGTAKLSDYATPVEDAHAEEIESVNVGEVTVDSIMPVMQPVEGSEYTVESDGETATFESMAPNIGSEPVAPTKQEVAEAISKAANEGKATTMPLGDHGTLVIAGVGSDKPKKSEDKPKVTLRKKTPQTESTLPVVYLVVYTTKRGEQAPRIEGFGGENDPRWKRHYDEKVRLAKEKKEADAFNEKLQAQMKGKPKDEREKLRKQWKSVGSDPFGASYFTDRTTGDKYYQMTMGAKYMEVARELVDAYNSGDEQAIAAAEQAVIDCKNGIVKDIEAQRDAKRAEREAQKAQAAAPAAKAQDAVTAGYSDQDVADMLRKVMAGGDVPENIKKLLQAA